MLFSAISSKNNAQDCTSKNKKGGNNTASYAAHIFPLGLPNHQKGLYSSIYNGAKPPQARCASLENPSSWTALYKIVKQSLYPASTDTARLSKKSDVTDIDLLIENQISSLSAQLHALRSSHHAVQNMYKTTDVLANRVTQKLESLASLLGPSEHNDVRQSLSNVRTSLKDKDTNETSNDETLEKIIKECANTYFVILMLSKALIAQARLKLSDIAATVNERRKDVDSFAAILKAFDLAKSGNVDFSKDPEMKNHINRVRASGFDMPFGPSGPYSFSEEQRNALRPSLEMKRDSIDKFNQMEMVSVQQIQGEVSSLQELISHTVKVQHDTSRTPIRHIGGH